MAMVTVIFGGETLGSHTIKHHPFVVGRDPTNDIPIDNIGVSRQHCQFVFVDRHFNIQDLESANGTILHGQKIRMSPIKDGDEISIGKYTLVFHMAPGEGQPPPKPGEGPSLADVMQGAEEKPATKGFAEGMKTFQVDAKLIHDQAAQGAGVGAQRAADVAKSFAPPQQASGGKKLWIVVGLLGLLVLGLIGAVVVLALMKG